MVQSSKSCVTLVRRYFERVRLGCIDLAETAIRPDDPIIMTHDPGFRKIVPISLVIISFEFDKVPSSPFSWKRSCPLDFRAKSLILLNSAHTVLLDTVDK